MLDKLKSAALKLDEISLKLTEPDIVNNNERYRELMKEYKNLTPLVEKYREYEHAAESFAEAELLLAEETDDELREMAKEQFQSSKSINILLVDTGAADNDHTEITAELIEDILEDITSYIKAALPEEPGNGSCDRDNPLLTGCLYSVLDLGINVFEKKRNRDTNIRLPLFHILNNISQSVTHADARTA